MANAKSISIQEFTEYVWKFYAPNEMYGEFFENNLTKEELAKAIKTRIKNAELEFYGDSIDREIVRDIMLRNRGVTGLEYDLSKYIA